MTKYLTPEKLGLTLRQYSALVATQFLLENNLITHKPWRDTKEGEHAFDMNHWFDQYDDEDEEGKPVTCGTLQCVGGTMEWLMGGRGGLQTGEVSMMETYERNPELRDLFFPGYWAEYNEDFRLHEAIGRHDWERITTAQAAKAIKNYRIYGNARWDSILDLSHGQDETYEANDE